MSLKGIRQRLGWAKAQEANAHEAMDVAFSHVDVALADLEVMINEPEPTPEPTPVPVPEPVPEPSASEAYPNEPAGLTRIAQHDFSCMPSRTDQCTIAGQWMADTRRLDNMSIVDAADAPLGPGKAIRLRFPAGENDGKEYARFDGWGPVKDLSGEHDYSELYVSFWMKIEGSDFENQTVGTKVFYIAYGSTIRSNHSAMFVGGTGVDQAIMTQMTPQYYIYEMRDDGSDAGGGSVKRNPNITDKPIIPGNWQHIEAYFKINDIGPTVDNGEFKMWIDGVQTHAYSGLRWRSDQNPLGFYHLQFTPIWGGHSGDVRTRDDFWQIADFYISAP